jgi:hypothetical protein
VANVNGKLTGSTPSFHVNYNISLTLGDTKTLSYKEEKAIKTDLMEIQLEAMKEMIPRLNGILEDKIRQQEGL